MQGQRGAKGDRGEENLNYVWSETEIFIFEINLSTTGEVGPDGLPVSEHLGVMSNDGWNFASSTFNATHRVCKARKANKDSMGSLDRRERLTRWASQQSRINNCYNLTTIK